MENIDTMKHLVVEDAIAAYDTLKTSKLDRFDMETVKIPFGTDGIEFLSFEKELRKNCSNIVRRLRNGAYFLSPVREIEVDKPDGGKRTLSIFTVRDNVAQSLIYQYIYPNFERVFSRREISNSSFAYRKGHSAQDAALAVREYLNQGYTHVLDIDISKFFDTVDHDILLEKIQRIYSLQYPEYKFLRRFIKVGYIKSDLYLGIHHFHRGQRFRSSDIFKVRRMGAASRKIGIPQGGKISGLLANLYLSDFDYFVCKTVGAKFDLKFVRYADDFLIMCKGMADLNSARVLITNELNNLKLKVNDKKTNVHIIEDGHLEYVGFDIGKYCIKTSERNIDKLKFRIVELLESLDIDRLRTLSHEKIIKSVVWHINNKIYGFSNTICEKCGKSKDGKPKSWMGFFAVSTQVAVFREIDIWLRRTLYKYLWNNYLVSAKRRNLKAARLASFEREYYRIRKIKDCKCGNVESVVHYRSLSYIHIISIEMRCAIIKTPRLLGVRDGKRI